MDHLQSMNKTPDRIDGAFFPDGASLPKEGQEHARRETFHSERATTHLQCLNQHMPPPAFAFLVDADNTKVEAFPEIVKKAETLGILTLRRAYGNHEALLGQKWKDLCLRYALQPMIHLGISGVKNATDIALVVDAMDLFHTQAIRHFCLITGDQDFTALVLRLRSYGCQVYGIGKPSKALAKVCTAFFPLEDLPEPISVVQEAPAKAPAPATKTQTKAPTPAKKKTAQSKTQATTAKKSLDDSDLTRLLTQAITAIMQETNLEWILASRLGARIKQLDPQFEPKTYGLKNFTLLCKALPDFFDCRPKGTDLEVHLKSTPIP